MVVGVLSSVALGDSPRLKVILQQSLPPPPFFFFILEFVPPLPAV
jgi:hypothetical protein